MAVRPDFLSAEPTLAGHSVFLSASIPDASRWSGEFDAMEITDAVVAAGRTVLSAGGRLVTAAHPTIAPLLLYLAAELSQLNSQQVVVYQSRLFDDVLPSATRRFMEDGVGELRWTDAIEGEEPVPGRWDQSLSAMRRTMLSATDPVCAIFVGGMEGIRDEFDLFVEAFPGRPTYAVGRPGGEARDLPSSVGQPLRGLLQSGEVYPAIWRRVVDDLASHLE